MPTLPPLPPGVAPPTPHRLWATSADGEGPDTRPIEMEALCSHLHQCTAAHSRLAAMQGGVLRLRGFMLGHLVSSLALLLVLLSAAWLLLVP